MEITREMIDAALAATDFANNPVSRRWMKKALAAALRHVDREPSDKKGASDGNFN